MLSDLDEAATQELLRRWRLILGPASEQGMSGEANVDSALAIPGAAGDNRGEGGGLGADDRERDQLLEHLYGREHLRRDYRAGQGEQHRVRQGGHEDSVYSTPRWLREVRKLFPRSTAETLQQQALERYGMQELLSDPEVLRNTPATLDTVRLLMQFRSLLSNRAMAEARRLIGKVVSELEERLARRVRNAIIGPRQRQQHGGRKSLANLDWHTTLRRNLKHYQPEQQLLIPERLWFWKRDRKALPWDLIVLVDQSGSMLDSVIHSAVLASIFHGLRTLRTRMVLFDTQVVDITDQVSDPVEVLLGVQLGGGTDIAAAMTYASRQVVTPRRTMLVLISDFYEGGDVSTLLRVTEALHQSDVTLLGLAALDERANPDYDHALAARLERAGMAIGAMTPDRLAQWIGEVMARRG